MVIEDLQTQSALVFAARPWYGKGVLESLRELPEEHWHKLIGHRTIAGLVGHMIAWRQFVTARLRDQHEFYIEMNTAADWPDCSNKTKANLIEELEASQQALKAAFAANTTAGLAEKVVSKFDYTKGDMAIGIIHHDVYHLGQINLLSALIQAGQA